MTDRPLRIAHYLQRVRLEDGGVVRAVLDMCQVLAARGVSVTLLTVDSIDVPPQWLEGHPEAPRVVQIDPPTRLGKLTASSEKIVLATLRDTDVLHIHTPWDTSNIRITQLARQTGTPYIISVHGMLDDWCMAQKALKKRVYLALRGRRMLEAAARVHCTAEAEMQQAQRWIGAGQPIVLPLIFDIEPFKALPGPELARQSLSCLSEQHANVLFLSRLHLKKGPEHLIDAAAILQRRGHTINVILAGPGEPDYIDRLRKVATDRGLSDRIHFPGMITGELKLSLYQAADIFALPSSQENFGLVFPEAMACGTPVITTRGVDIWRELEKGGAFIVPPTGEAFANAIEQLLTNPTDRHARGERSRAFIFQWLAPDHVADQYITVYRDIVNQSSPAARHPTA